MYSPQQQPQLPHQPPFVVQAPVTSQFQQFLPLCTGMAMMIAMQSANISVFRNMYVGALSQNNWQNPLFEQLARTVAQIAEYYTATQNMPPQQSVQKAADRAVQMLTALFCMQNQHALANEFAKPGTMQAIMNLINEYQQTEAAVMQFYNQMAAQMQPTYGGVPQQQVIHNSYTNMQPQYGQMPVNQVPAYQNAYPQQGQYAGTGVTGITAGALTYNGGFGNRNRQAQQQQHNTQLNYQSAPPPQQMTYPQPQTGLSSALDRKTRGFNASGDRPAPKPLPGYQRSTEEERRATGIVDELHFDQLGNFPVPEQAVMQRNDPPEPQYIKPLRAQSRDVVIRNKPEVRSPLDRLPSVESSQSYGYNTPTSEIQNEPVAEAAVSSVNISQLSGYYEEAKNRKWYNLKGLQWPKVANPDRPWDMLLLESGEILMPACLSPLKVTRDPDLQPYRLAFNRLAEILYHGLLPDGTVVEQALNWELGMDYEEHELDREARIRFRESRDRNENVAFDMSKVRLLEQVDSTSVALVNGDKLERMAAEAKAKLEEVQSVESEPIVAEEPEVSVTAIETGIRASDFKEAEQKALLRLKRNGLNAEDPYEYYVDIIKSTLAKPESIAHLDSAVNSKNGIEAIEHLKKIAENDVRRQADQMMTERINSVLNNELGISWTISSFIDDFEDLIRELESNYGDLVVSQINRNFSEIIGAGLPIQTDASGDTVQFARNRMGIEESEIAEANLALAVYQQRSSVTVVPWTYEELGVVARHDEPVLVNPKQESQRELHRTLSSILKRTIDFPISYRHRFIKTADDKIIEIYRGYLIEGAILIRLSALPAN